MDSRIRSSDGEEPGPQGPAGIEAGAAGEQLQEGLLEDVLDEIRPVEKLLEEGVEAVLIASDDLLEGGFVAIHVVLEQLGIRQFFERTIHRLFPQRRSLYGTRAQV